MNRKTDRASTEGEPGAARRRGSAAQSGFLASMVSDAIVEMIASGRLTPGQRLVEPVLAKALGVGTVPVREALRVLAGDGVVELVPNRGARLREMTAKQVADTLKAVTGLLLTALDERPSMTVDDLARLEEIASLISRAQAQGDGRAVLGATDDYQRELVKQSGNEYIMTLMNRVHFSYYIGQLLRFIEPTNISELPSRYRSITEALRRGDVDAAKAFFVENRQAVLHELGLT